MSFHARSSALALRLTLAALLVSAAIAVVVRMRADAPPNTAQTTSREPAPAPQPIAPPDGTFFVESTQTLIWEWTPGLGADQRYAVRVWFADESPREVWTTATTVDARDVIDSYAQAVGPYHWQVAVITVDATGGFAAMASAWSPVQTLQRVRHLSPTPVPPEQRSAAAQLVVSGAPASAAETIDAVRIFVSTHSDASAQDRFAPDYRDALAMMADFAAGEGAKPRLLCDGQATAALTLLAELGVDSRLIFLYGDAIDSVQEHTILEVFNPDTQRWELHDVVNNRYFVDEHGARTTIERLVFGPLTTVSICAADGTCAPLRDSGYPHRGLFEAFRYGHSDTFWVNPDRFDVTKRFPTNQNRNLAEYLTGNPRDFVFRFDSWRED